MKRVTISKLILSLFAIALLWIICLPAMANDNDPFFFVQIADPQIGFNNRRTTRDMSEEIAHYQKAVDFINRINPAFVVVNGDMTNNNIEDQKQVCAFWQITSKIKSDVPVHFVCGNHDLAKATPECVSEYNKMFGRDRYWFSHNGSYFIAINTDLIYSTCAAQGLKEGPKTLPESARLNDPAKEMRDAQRQWLEDTLAYAQQKNANHIFVLTHHPWFVRNPDEKDHYENIPLSQRFDYLNLLDRYGVQYSLSGHTHVYRSVQYKKLDLVTSSALCKANVGLVVFKVYPDKVEHTFYQLDKLPDKVEL